MKLLKRIFLFGIVLTQAFTLTSCNLFNTKENNKDTDNVPEVNDPSFEVGAIENTKQLLERTLDFLASPSFLFSEENINRINNYGIENEDVRDLINNILDRIEFEKSSLNMLDKTFKNYEKALPFLADDLIAFYSAYSNASEEYEKKLTLFKQSKIKIIDSQELRNYFNDYKTSLKKINAFVYKDTIFDAKIIRCDFENFVYNEADENRIQKGYIYFNNPCGYKLTDIKLNKDYKNATFNDDYSKCEIVFENPKLISYFSVDSFVEEVGKVSILINKNLNYSAFCRIIFKK